MDSPKQTALAILDEIHRIGFPNNNNIQTLSELVQRLHTLSHAFIESDQVAISQAIKALHKIEIMLNKEGDVHEKLYTLFNCKLILLKTGLQNHGYS